MIFFGFILAFIISEFFIFSVRFLLRKKEIKLWLNVSIGILEIICSIAIAFITMAGPVFPIPVVLFQFAIYAALMTDGIGNIVFLIINRIKKQNNKLILKTIISLCLGIIFLTFGIINMEVVKPKYISLSSNKIDREYKVAFVSDMHISSSQPVSVSINTIRKIKAENPDFILLGGDIIDEYTKKEDMEKVLSEFKDTGAKVYFIYGNHDPEMNITIAEYEDCLRNNGITIVNDEYVKIDESIALLGRKDYSDKTRKEIDELINPYNDCYLIVVDHQPFYFIDNCKTGLDLQLSGHTHAGQIAPIRLIYCLTIYSYGTYHYGDAMLNVSSGASGWVAPFRTEIGCQYEIITITPSN